jgi:hypothetical protein
LHLQFKVMMLYKQVRSNNIQRYVKTLLVIALNVKYFKVNELKFKWIETCRYVI